MKTTLSIIAALGLRACAWNTATTDALWKDRGTAGGDLWPADDASGIASNAESITTDEWIRIAKYGEWNDGSKARTLQVLALDNATAMARNFNSMVGKIGRFMRGAPIFIGHPDCLPEVYTDHRRIGKITALDARAAGLYAKPVWNDLGVQNLREGYHVYPSSVWRLPRPKPGATKVYPVMFQSLGLTNFPAGDVEPVTFNSDTQPENDTAMNPELLTLLGLAEGATPEDILAAVTALKEAAAAKEETTAEETEETTETEEETVIDEEKAAMNAQLTALQAECSTAQNALAGYRTAEASRLIGDALASGALTGAEKAGWEARFATDHTAAVNAIAALRPGSALNTKPIALGESKVNITTARDRMHAVNAEVKRRIETDGLTHDAAYNAVKKDTEWAHVFQAMTRTTAE